MEFLGRTRFATMTRTPLDRGLSSSRDPIVTAVMCKTRPESEKSEIYISLWPGGYLAKRAGHTMVGLGDSGMTSPQTSCATEGLSACESPRRLSPIFFGSFDSNYAVCDVNSTPTI